jgi:hypothetical protein
MFGLEEEGEESSILRFLDEDKQIGLQIYLLIPLFMALV